MRIKLEDERKAAIQDARAFMLGKLEDLEGEIHEEDPQNR